MTAHERASGPKSNRDPACVERKLARLRDPHIASLTLFVERLRKRGHAVPWFDPADGGTNARILFLQEAPGGMASLQRGSGFISCDNDDQTAETTWGLLAEAGIPRSSVVLWNAVPWYLGGDTKIRNASAADIAQALPATRELLGLLPHVEVVVLLGKPAQSTWRKLGIDGPAVVNCHHPSPHNVHGRGWRPLMLESFREARAAAS